MFVEVRATAREIYPDVFGWIDRVGSKGRTSIEIDVFGDDVQKIPRLEENGLSFACHFETKRTSDLEQIGLGYEPERIFSA